MHVIFSLRERANSANYKDEMAQHSHLFSFCSTVLSGINLETIRFYLLTFFGLHAFWPFAWILAAPVKCINQYKKSSWSKECFSLNYYANKLISNSFYDNTTERNGLEIALKKKKKKKQKEHSIEIEKMLGWIKVRGKTSSCRHFYFCKRGLIYNKHHQHWL